jgi:hypothetical protein
VSAQKTPAAAAEVGAALSVVESPCKKIAYSTILLEQFLFSILKSIYVALSLQRAGIVLVITKVQSVERWSLTYSWSCKLIQE